MRFVRFVVAACALLGVAWSITYAASQVENPYSVIGWMITVLGGPVIIVVLGALYEWLVHKFLYHGKSSLPVWKAIYVIHHRGHHWHRFPPDRYVEAPPLERIPVFPPKPFGVSDNALTRAVAWLFQYLLYFAVGLPFAFLPIWLLTHNVPFTISSVVSGMYCCYMFIRVHDVMHYPEGSWIERQGWFRFLNRHHYIHHIDTKANLNFMLPLGDLLFGTLRTTLTETEQQRWPSFEEASRPLE